jgi:hypothetical protein
MKGYQRLSDDADGVFEQLSDGLRFGSAVGDLGDLDGDGVPELIVGTAPDFVDDPTPNNALWILYSLPLPLTSTQNMRVSPDQPAYGEPIAVRGRWGIGLNSATLFFRKAGDTSFLGAAMLESDAEVYETEIPAFSVGEGGAEYYVSLVSTAGIESRVPEAGYLSIPVELPQGVGMRAPHGRAASGFRLISFPLQLFETDARVVLEDDLGPYDPVRWRLYGFGPTLTELGQADLTLSPGRSFWLLSGEEGLQIDSGPGVTVPTDDVFSVAVNRGWNLAANPFLVPLPTGAVRFASGETVDGIVYDGDWIPVGDVLAPMEGFAIFSPSSDTLLFDPTERESQAKSSGTGSKAKLDWSVQVSARVGRARDLVNVAGVHAEAREHHDPFDRPEPPTIGDYVSAYFPADGQFMGRLRSDLRPSGMSGYVWPVEIRTEVAAPIRVSFRLHDVPAEFEVWLVDDDTGVSHQVEHGYESALAPYVSSDRARRLRLIVGPESFIRREGGTTDASVPSFALEQSFPNPFRSVTSLRYRLSESVPVELEIVDLLGREMVTLVDEMQEAGVHVAVWDGRDASGRPVSSGVFIARLRAGSFSASNTLTLIK